MAVVAIACCRYSGDSSPTILYPDRDRQLVIDGLKRAGVDALPVSWDDPNFDWTSVDGVLVRSTWDSVDRPEEYIRWARRVEASTTLLNPAGVIEWSLDKAYLRDLAADGLEVVPTEWVRPGETWAPARHQDLVVKPAVSAGGRNTAWYSRDQAQAAQAHVSRLQALGQTVLVQAYMASVESPGEIDLVYIDGHYSHAVRKGPLLERDSEVHARPWERMSWLGLSEPSKDEHTLGDAAMAALASRFGALAYARVDVLILATGQPALLEVELIDPHLSLLDCPPAATTLAAVVARRLQRR